MSTKPGAKAMCIIVSHAGVKERKRIMKSLKTHTLESLLHDSAFLTIMRLVDVTDDTVTVQKSLLEEIRSPLPDIKYTATGDVIGTPYPPLISIAKHRNGSKLLLRLLSPQSKHLEPGDETSLFSSVPISSKKAPAVRRREHLAYLKAPLLQVAAQYTEELIRCRSGSKVLEEVVRTFFPITVLDSVARIFVGLPVEVQEGGDEMTFEDDDDEDDEETTLNHVKSEKTGDESDDDEDNGEEMDIDKALSRMVAVKASSSIGMLRSSSRYVKHLAEVAFAYENNNLDLITEIAETDPEYKLILTSNKIVQEIDEEILGTQRYVTEIYAKKFPELDSLVSNKIDYIQTVKRIGNEMDMTLVELSDLLPSTTVMIVSVTGSTTSGVPLNQGDLAECFKGCEEVLTLDSDKAIVLRFVESRMSRIAPNLSHLIGARVAAQLVGLAGGLVALSKIPACNIQVIGQEKRNLGGFSNVAAMPHIGVLHYCDLVQSCPPFLRRKALKNVSAKVALAIRVDSYQIGTDVTEGAKLRRDLEDKLEKLQEPAKAKTKKALPIPEEKKRSKRGGKRVKRMKERYSVTDLQAAHNKMNFSMTEGEYGDSAMGLDNGMVNSTEGGKMRAPQKKDNKVGLTKKQKTQMTAISANNTSGLSSSLVFTPVKGIELVNPNAAAERIKAANNKWFNASSGFISAAPSVIDKSTTSLLG
mmetsp:Transcript_15693/g.15032  ORF Transcript_15693/g.15032 Transcript_15693/m.15032 type:complete len:699 (+) Transcript_15693:1115-3211(+)